MKSRTRVRTIAGWLALSVFATLLFGVAALWMTDRANRQQLEEFERTVQVVKASRLAQVNFKTQVQEWKNILLRGQNAADYERHLEAFHARATDTTTHLEQASGIKTTLELDSSDVTAALTEHAALMRAYETALEGYVRSDAASAFAVDAGIRGRDRRLNEMIDAIAESMTAEATARTQAFAAADRERYERLRAVLIGLALATLVLTGWLVALTLGARPDPTG